MFHVTYTVTVFWPKLCMTATRRAFLHEARKPPLEEAVYRSCPVPPSLKVGHTRLACIKRGEGEGTTCTRGSQLEEDHSAHQGSVSFKPLSPFSRFFARPMPSVFDSAFSLLKDSR